MFTDTLLWCTELLVSGESWIGEERQGASGLGFLCRRLVFCCFSRIAATRKELLFELCGKVCFLFFFLESLSFNDLFSQLLLKIRRVKFLDCTNLPNKGES